MSTASGCSRPASASSCIDLAAGTSMTCSLEDVRAAAERIASSIHRTPVLTSELLDAIAGASLFFKCENLQKAGAFKSRGAVNAVMSLTDDEAARGVATHSSGNHGAALARAARLRGIPAWIVVPVNARAVKKAAIEQYGARIIECASTLEARESALARVLEETGACFVPPYDDDRIIAGQGTAVLELVQQVENLDCIVTPVGGGGLLAGSALVCDAEGIVIYGAEPENADDAFRSFQSGERVTSHVPDTIADGLLTTLGERNFDIISDKVDDILLVSEQQIVDAMELLWTRLKVVVEASAAVTLAAVLRHRELFAGRRVGAILTGGNVDVADLPFRRRGAD